MGKIDYCRSEKQCYELCWKLCQA